jgi:hypothetical protein
MNTLPVIVFVPIKVFEPLTLSDPVIVAVLVNRADPLTSNV